MEVYCEYPDVNFFSGEFCKGPHNNNLYQIMNVNDRECECICLNDNIVYKFDTSVLRRLEIKKLEIIFRGPTYRDGQELQVVVYNNNGIENVCYIISIVDHDVLLWNINKGEYRSYTKAEINDLKIPLYSKYNII